MMPQRKPKAKTKTAPSKLASELDRMDMLDRWSSPQQADPFTILRHVAVALGEKADWCDERAYGAFDCIGRREQAEEEMLDWLTLAGELRALQTLIGNQTASHDE